MWPIGWLRSGKRHGSARQRPSFRPTLEALEARWVPSTLTVQTNLDGGRGSLRAEISAANSGDTIVFAPSLDGQTITLTKGELLIKTNLTIAGPGAGELTVSGNNASRVVEVAAGTQVTLSGLTISNGLVVGAGGGILNAGTLTVSGSTVSGNFANYKFHAGYYVGGDGGGIDNSGTLTVSDHSTLSGNSAAAAGAGIYNERAGMLTVSGSTLSGNSLHNSGGGIWNDGTATLSGGSIVSGNSAWDGAGIVNSGTLTISDSTLSNNIAGYNGGGISNDGGTLTVSNSILAGNSAANDGGAIYNSYGGTVTVSGSILGPATTNGITLPGNSAAEGGGIWNWGTLTVENSSSITGNTAPAGFGADVYNLGVSNLLGVLYLDSSSSITILDGNGAVVRI